MIFNDSIPEYRPCCKANFAANARSERFIQGTFDHGGDGCDVADDASQHRSGCLMLSASRTSEQRLLISLASCSVGAAFDCKTIGNMLGTKSWEQYMPRHRRTCMRWSNRLARWEHKWRASNGLFCLSTPPISSSKSSTDGGKLSRILQMSLVSMKNPWSFVLGHWTHCE